MLITANIYADKKWIKFDLVRVHGILDIKCQGFTIGLFILLTWNWQRRSKPLVSINRTNKILKLRHISFVSERASVKTEGKNKNFQKFASHTRTLVELRRSHQSADLMHISGLGTCCTNHRLCFFSRNSDSISSISWNTSSLGRSPLTC